MKVKTKKTDKDRYATMVENSLPIAMATSNNEKEIELPDNALRNKIERREQKEVIEKRRISLLTKKLSGFSSTSDLIKVCESQSIITWWVPVEHWIGRRYYRLTDVGLIIDSPQAFEIAELIRQIYPDGRFDYYLCELRKVLKFIIPEDALVELDKSGELPF